MKTVKKKWLKIIIKTEPVLVEAISTAFNSGGKLQCGGRKYPS